MIAYNVALYYLENGSLASCGDQSINGHQRVNSNTPVLVHLAGALQQFDAYNLGLVVASESAVFVKNFSDLSLTNITVDFTVYSVFIGNSGVMVKGMNTIISDILSNLLAVAIAVPIAVGCVIIIISIIIIFYMRCDPCVK